MFDLMTYPHWSVNLQGWFVLRIPCALFPGEMRLCSGVVSSYSFRAFLLHKLLGHVDRLCLRQDLKLRQLCCRELG